MVKVVKMTSAFHTGIAQLNPVVGDIDGNKHLVEQAVDAIGSQCDVLIFSEMFISGYPPEDLILKPSFQMKCDEAIHALVEQSVDWPCAVVVGAPYKENGRLYNAAYAIDKGKIIGVVKKHHLPNYGVFDEHRLFTSANLQGPLTIRGHKLGVMICEDMWYENVAQNLAEKGAEMLIVLNGSPFDAVKTELRQHHAELRVQDTNLPLIYVNQYGGQDELVFDGASFAVTESGQLVYQGPEFEKDYATITWEKTQTGNWLCAKTKITETLDQDAVLYEALICGLRDYALKNNFPGVLIGLSGGIDSALAATLAVDAFGPENVHCVMMPSPYTSQASLDDAAALAANLGVRLDTVAITEAVKTFEHVLQPLFTPDAPGETFENMQSRARGLILMALSNASGKMVLSTGNKSEMAVGYSTLYGDMCGGFNVLKDVYKGEVYALSNWRNKAQPRHGLGPSGQLIPQSILDKAPSAELRDNQTDQDSLPPYDVLDDILECLVERDMSLAATANRGHDQEMVLKIWRLLDRAEYKRRQAPPGVKITARAFGRDRRYPITNGFK